MNTRIRSRLWLVEIVIAVLLGTGSLLQVMAQGQCPLTMRVSYTPVQHLTIADIDLEHFQSHRILFMFDISNQTDSIVHASLIITLDIRLSNGTEYDNALYLETEPFPVPPGGRTVTNLNLGESGTDIPTREFHIRDEVRNNIEDIALSTGKFPAGNYYIRPKLICENGADASCPDCLRPIEFDIQNPSRVELRSPADGETTNEFPFFEFYSDGSQNILTVAEKNPDQSREDAITRRPPMAEVELKNQFSFLYSGGRPLEPGKTYVWRVVCRSLGVGAADVDVASPIGLFTVSASGAGGRVSDALLEQLEELFGQRYPEIFRQIRNGNFHFTGQFSRDDSPLDETSLINLLNELRLNPDAVDLSFE